jgi:hypothetical protein
MVFDCPQFTINYASTIPSWRTLLVVAFTPSNSFVAASSSAPVHTVSTTQALRASSPKREMKAAWGANFWDHQAP